MHLLQRCYLQSGTHIIIFSGIVIAFIRALGVPRMRWLFFLAPMLILYTMGTGMAPSALRACVMAIAYWSALLFKRKPDGPSALSLAALILLFADPTQLKDPGFVLSFGAVAGLMALYSPLVRLLKKPVEEDPLALKPTGLSPEIKRFVVALAASSVAAWLSTTPLTAWYFNQFQPVALVVNLFVIPLATVILFTGCLSLLAGVCSLALAEIFNYANAMFVSLMLKIIAWFDQLPGSHFFVQPPAWPWIVLCYLAIAAAFYGSQTARRATLAAAALTVVLALGFWWSDDRVSVDVTAAGPAGVVFVNVPGGGDVLVDTGSRYHGRALLRWLRARGVDRLRAVVVTRAKADVMGGAAVLLDKIPVRELWLPDYDARSPLYDQLLKLAADKKITVRHAARGQRGEWSGGVAWDVLHPAPDGDYHNAAEAGLVLRVARGPSSVLIVGEDHETLERELAGSAQELAASAVVFGSSGIAPDSLLCRVNPRCLPVLEGEEMQLDFAPRDGWRWPDPELRITQSLRP